MESPPTYPFELPPLAFAYDALEPVIDADTMRLHHGKHHQTYIDGLNAAIKDHPELQCRSVEDLLRHFGDVPETIETAVRNHGGGHANHQMFWKVIRPAGTEGAGGEPGGDLLAAIDAQFGSVANLKTAFVEAGTKLVGSGWTFLVADPKSMKLSIITTPNQDSVLLHPGQAALFGNDCWEHAYYLMYQNRRADYLKAWWGVLAWDIVGRRFDGIKAGKSHL